MFAIMKNRKGIYGIGLLHILIAFSYSFFFFRGLGVEAGIENRAYAYLRSGENLMEDKLSRIFCILASYLLATFLIFLFWKFLACLLERLRKKSGLAILFSVILIVGIIVIFCLYPEMFGVETTDDYMNYAYAREFLPMYWHGFFTNVVYCACMIVFPHPVAIPIIQFLFGLSILFWFGHMLMMQLSDRKMAKVFLAVGFFLLVFLLPETVRILICPTRNCMYGIVCYGATAVLFGDYMEKAELTIWKFILLVFLFAILGCWRGEGILYLVAFPFLVYFTYIRQRKKIFTRSHGKWLLFYLFVCLTFMLPDKYGVNKYQNSDYMIANTTGPISAMLHDEQANLSYEGAAEDLENIRKVIPLEYIYEYGCNGGFYWNAVSGRWIRQSGATEEEGSRYISSAYRLLLHNLPDYLKYQWNLFLDANSIKGFRFWMEFGKNTMENALELSPYVRAFELYDAGEENLEKYSFLAFGNRVRSILAKGIFDSNYKKSLNEMGIAGGIKLLLVVFAFSTALAALFQKNYQYFLLVALNLAVLTVIILMAPWGRPNYYYYVFQNLYLGMLYYACQIRKR